MLIRLLLLLTLLVMAPPAGAEGPPRVATTGPVPDAVETPDPQALQDAINRGVDFLIEDQRPNGGWAARRKPRA